MIHQHAWTLVNPALGRYRCYCGVLAHKTHKGIVPYACQYELAERKHCARDAVHVVAGQRASSRCGEHFSIQQSAASRG